MAAGGLSFLLTIVAFATLPLTFQPPLDLGVSQLKIQMVPGTTLAQTEAVTDRAAAILRRSPTVDVALEDIDVGQAAIYVALKEDRTQSTTDFERALIPELRNIADARINFQSQSGGGGARHHGDAGRRRSRQAQPGGRDI